MKKNVSMKLPFRFPSAGYLLAKDEAEGFIRSLQQQYPSKEFYTEPIEALLVKMK